MFLDLFSRFQKNLPRGQASGLRNMGSSTSTRRPPQNFSGCLRSFSLFRNIKMGEGYLDALAWKITCVSHESGCFIIRGYFVLVCFRSKNPRHFNSRRITSEGRVLGSRVDQAKDKSARVDDLIKRGLYCTQSHCGQCVMSALSAVVPEVCEGSAIAHTYSCP